MRVLLAGGRPEDRLEGRRAALRVGLECAATDCVPFDGLRMRLAREPAVHLVALYWDDDPEAADRALSSAAELTRQPVYAVSGRDGGRTGALAAGAAGVFAPDRLQEELLAATDALLKAGRAPDTRGRVLAVVAAQGGTGVTTVATGLAFGLAARADESVVLAELGPAVPALALNLDLSPRHSLRELVREHARLDATMLRGAATVPPSGPGVLAYSPEDLSTAPLTEAVAHDFQVLFRSTYRWAVVDGGCGLAGLDLMLQADAVVLVTRLDPTGLRLGRRLSLELVERGVPADALVTVANRFGQYNLVPWKKAEEALRTTLAAWLPDDPTGVNKALRDGKPVAGKLGRALNQLADQLRTRFAPAAR